MLFEAAPVPNPALPVLLTNRQLGAEMQDVLRRRFADRRPDYAVDVVYLKDGTLWPTWLSVPVPADHVDTLTARFRLFSCPADMVMPLARRLGLFDSGIGGQPTAIWLFYHLLTVSFTRGPLGSPITARRLVLDFLPAEEEDILPLGGGFGYRSRSKKDFYATFLPGNYDAAAEGPADAGSTAAAMMAAFVKAQLRRLLVMVEKRGDWDYGKPLYENIGEIELRQAGKVLATFDLTSMLVKAYDSAVRSHQNNGLDPWWPWVEARRLELFGR